MEFRLELHENEVYPIVRILPILAHSPALKILHITHPTEEHTLDHYGISRFDAFSSVRDFKLTGTSFIGWTWPIRNLHQLALTFLPEMDIDPRSLATHADIYAILESSPDLEDLDFGLMLRDDHDPVASYQVLQLTKLRRFSLGVQDNAHQYVDWLCGIIEAPFLDSFAFRGFEVSDVALDFMDRCLLTLKAVSIAVTHEPGALLARITSKSPPLLKSLYLKSYSDLYFWIESGVIRSLNQCPKLSELHLVNIGLRDATVLELLETVEIRQGELGAIMRSGTGNVSEGASDLSPLTHVTIYGALKPWIWHALELLGVRTAQYKERLDACNPCRMD